MDLAFLWIQNGNKLPTEAQYPYTAKDGTCKSVKGSVGVKDYTDVKTNSPAQLKAALNKQPVSVAVEADKAVFQHYTSGVITGSACGTSLDHGVLAVGYGADYYIVKNSWGAAWGDKGYLKIGVEAGAGVCGIQSTASYPTD